MLVLAPVAHDREPPQEVQVAPVQALGAQSGEDLRPGHEHQRSARIAGLVEAPGEPLSQSLGLLEVAALEGPEDVPQLEVPHHLERIDQQAGKLRAGDRNPVGAVVVRVIDVDERRAKDVASQRRNAERFLPRARDIIARACEDTGVLGSWIDDCRFPKLEVE